MTRALAALTGAVISAAVVFAVILRLGGGAAPHPQAAAAVAQITDPSRARITEFWAVYRQATQAKQAGQWAQAAAAYTRALELDPNHWDSLYYLGNSLMELGRYEAAHKAYARLAAADSQAARAHSALGSLYSTPAAGKLFNLKSAAAEFQKARSANGDESGSVLRLGEVALAAGDIPKAREYLAAASRTDFKSVTARFLEGYVAWHSGSKHDAAAKFAEAVVLTRGQKPPAGVLGEGDTKLPGFQAMTRPHQQGLFQPFVAEIWREENPGPEHAESLYHQVREFIQKLQKQERSAG